jgi:2-(1,2-epoxy-1,2-dihydrophenyl)acetyl-CoA isomerase
MTVAQPLLVTRPRPEVAWLALNRPEARNALTEALMDELLAALEAVAADSAVRCVVLTGTPPAFCGGADVKERGQRWVDPPPASTFGPQLAGLITGLRTRTRVVELLHLMPKPTIAMVNGAAAGAGFALALACDFRLVAADAFASTAYANNALCGDYGITYFLTLLAGPAEARKLLMLPERLPAERLAELGLATEVVPPADLAARTAELAARLAEGPTFAYGKMKENLALAAAAGLGAVLDLEALNTRLTGHSDDAREGVTAIVEKRTARFTGR